MKKVFLFLASCLVAFAASAATYSVTIKDSQLGWSENGNGQMEARISLSSISSLLKKGDQIKISYSGGDQNYSPYTIAIVDQSEAAEWWYELSDWSDAIELNESGSGSTTVTLTKSAMDKGSIIAFFVYDLVIREKKWDFQSGGLFYKIQEDGTVWVTHGTLSYGSYGENSSYVSYTNYYSAGENPTENNIVIPSEVSYEGVDYVVRGIDNYAFMSSKTYGAYSAEDSYNYLDIQTLEIPSTVKYIGSAAFKVGKLFIEDIESFCKIDANLLRIDVLYYTTNYLNWYDDLYESHKVITSLEIPSSVEKLDGRFSCLKNLSSIVMSANTDASESGLYIEKNGVKYQVLNGKEISVVSGDKEKCSGDIVIPGSIRFGNNYSVKSIESYAFKDCIGLTSVVILNNMATIEGYAFSGCTNLKSLVIGEKVESIGPGAFSGCSSLSKITCYAVEPPTVDASSFSNYNGYLTIPCDNFEAYDIHSVWGTFKHVDCLSAESVDIEKDAVVVEPDVAKAAFSMPINEDANSYTLTISNNGEVFCSITFNAQGQLANIDFSTTKSYELKSDVAAYQFTVTGLSAATDYGYSFKALNKSKAVLKEYTGTFTTKNEDGTGGSVQGGGEGSGQGGQGGSTAVSEVSNATAVTIVNGQILVNGEAPAFVVTVSGQKIANANLKAGVYFVVADGETVGVSVR